MSDAEPEVNVFECRSCGAFRLACAETICCDEPMEAVADTVPRNTPELEDVMREVFGMAATELDICRCAMAEGDATIEEFAERIDRDRSVIWRHLNHLHDMGLVEKRSCIRSEGGRVDVYSPVSEDMVRRQLKLGLYVWLIDAVDAVDTVSQEKIEAMAEARKPDDDGSGREILSRVFGRDGVS